ncbi:YcaO-like family protein [Streptomyces sp. MN13]
MIDVLPALEPSAGLVTLSRISPPAPPADLLWRCTVELARAEPDRAGGVLSARLAGAHGHSSTDAMLRGVGEAVERYALHPDGPAPAGTVRATAAGLGSRAQRFHGPDVALGAGTDRELTWYPATRLRDGATVLVPSALVDYPLTGPDADGFDPSPSGAAAGEGWTAAVRSALLETVERDAFQVAWERDLRPVRVADPGTDRTLTRLLRRAAQAGLEAVLAEVPTGVPGVACAIGVVVDEAGPHPLATLGCKASDDPARRLLGALQEALQIRSAALVARERADRWPGGAVRDDDDRLRFLASPEGYAQVRAWADAFAQDGPGGPGGPGDPAARRVSTDELVRAMVADGADPLIVDLTHRLPLGVRESGWAAVKAVPVGYQQLRIDDTRTDTWNRARLASAEARTGLTAGPAPTGVRPHPLP